MKVILLNIFLFFAFSINAQIKNVHATVETSLVSGAWAADDGAFWVHPTNTDSSLIIGVDKSNDGRLELFNMDGSLHFHTPTGFWMNNVDVRYNVLFDSQRIDVAVSSNTTNGSIDIYKIDPTSRTLINITGNTNVGFNAIYGLALYQDKCADKLYAYVTPKPGNGSVYQFEIIDNGSGEMDAILVRTISFGTMCEGVVIDDVYHKAYIGEEDVALWSVGAKATDPTNLTKVDSVSGPNLDVDIEGLTIYYSSDTTGYLIVCSQYSNYYSVYDRVTNNFIGKFSIVHGIIDDCFYPDGIDVISFGLGSSFSQGAFLSHDFSNDVGNPNYKIVPWQSIADSLGLDISPYNPRNLGSTSILTIKEECLTDSILLYTPDLMNSFSWNNGMSGDSIYVSDTGFYSLSGVTTCGDFIISNSIYIDSFPCDTNSLIDTSVIDTTVATNISSISELNFKVYPNPFREELTVVLGSFKTGFIRLYDVSGKLVKQINIEESQTIVDSNDLTIGVYFIEIQIGERKKVLKLIKR